jgi:hypothetical protein
VPSGSSFGAVVDGYHELDSIHARMFSAVGSAAGGSRFSIEHVRRLRDDIVVAFVRRTSDATGEAIEPGRADTFDELALFVLVRVDRTRWLAAGRHVPDRRDVYR